MTDMVEGGASLAWRLLATLEGGSLLLATSALLAYSARKRVVKLNKRKRKPVKSVLLTNTSNLLGRELKSRLESRGCTVHSLPEVTLTDGVTNEVMSRATSGATSGASFTTNEPSEANIKVDALVVVGAFSAPQLEGLQGMAKLVSEDVYRNLKLLESLSSVVHRGGSLAWGCAGASTEAAEGTWPGAGDAFDMVLQANLDHIAKMAHCEPVWVGRCTDAGEAAEKLVDALLSSNGAQHIARFSVRNAAQKAGEYIGRWLKIIT